jgi:hypothetical protein
MSTLETANNIRNGDGLGECHQLQVEPEEELPNRKKQKRNKPTLSCEECVERKTKVSIIGKLSPRL